MRSGLENLLLRFLCPLITNIWWPGLYLVMTIPQRRRLYNEDDADKVRQSREWRDDESWWRVWFAFAMLRQTQTIHAFWSPLSNRGSSIRTLLILDDALHGLTTRKVHLSLRYFPRDEQQRMNYKLTSIYRNSLWLWRFTFTSFWCFSRNSFPIRE